MNKDFKYWVEKLEMLPHPEGGFYKETYRSKGSISEVELGLGFNGDRSFCTAIYFLLTAENFSAFHKIASDELWHFYAGDGLDISVIHPNGEYECIHLGNGETEDQVFQALVPAGAWFASQPSNNKGWALVGCTVAPGFDFEDFEMAKRVNLIKEYPQYKEVIEHLTRD